MVSSPVDVVTSTKTRLRNCRTCVTHVKLIEYDLWFLTMTKKEVKTHNDNHFLLLVLAFQSLTSSSPATLRAKSTKWVKSMRVMTVNFVVNALTMAPLCASPNSVDVVFKRRVCW